MKLTSDFFVAAHQYSQSPCNARLYESQDEAINDLKESPHKNQLYIMKLTDFHWMIDNKKLSPRAIKLNTLC